MLPLPACMHTHTHTHVCHILSTHTCITLTHSHTTYTPHNLKHLYHTYAYLLIWRHTHYAHHTSQIHITLHKAVTYCISSPILPEWTTFTSCSALCPIMRRPSSNCSHVSTSHLVCGQESKSSPPFSSTLCPMAS